MSGSEAPIKAGKRPRPSATFRSVRPFAASRCPGKGAQMARRRHLGPASGAEGSMPRSVCAPAKCAASMLNAAPPSAKWATRKTTCANRQGRCPALARHPSDGPWRRHEPDRPPARRRRRPYRRGSCSGQSVGPAHQGLPDPQEQAHEQHDRAAPSQALRGRKWDVL